MSKVLILAPFSDTQLERLRSRLEVMYESWMDTGKLLSSEQFIERLEGDGIDFLVVEADFVQRDVFEKVSRLQLLGVCRGDAFQIDVQAATDNGVLVVNTPARNATAVAELTVGLMLSLARRITEAHDMVRSGRWVDPTAAYFSMRGSELSGKTIGIIGFGAIGRKVAKFVSAFDTAVLACDPYITAEQMGDCGAEKVSLDQLMSVSDYVSIHCSTIAGTVGLINERRIAMMKQTAYLVNAASSYVIDEEALFTALKERRIAGAGFDVYSSWPVRADSPLLTLDNVVLTPHIGGATAETIERHSTMIADDIERYLNGERPLHLLNPEIWGRSAG
ncbi:MAG: 3-phosphoglycerate dehydrogenase [Dehalococcoidia bacterium]|nr:3-phosphoglycerate dehydrogenase [Dehalococcoidia bacterium]